MRIYLRQVMLSLAAVLAFHAGLVLADEGDEAVFPSRENQTTAAADNETVAASSLLLASAENSKEAAFDADIDGAMQCHNRAWTIDYRISSMFNSHTTYEFGTSPLDGPDQYTPLSKLNWSLDATWHGLRVGVEKPNWKTHFQWLTPMTNESYGRQEDFDWSGPDRAPASLSASPQRWVDAQMIELEGSIKLADRCGNLPIEIWPLVGFRFQRFDMMAHDGIQLINDHTMPDLPEVGYRWDQDTISFNQQYYIGYIGGQLCTTLRFKHIRPILVTFQGDWGATAAYNVDHHISGYEDEGKHRYTMESTHGGALHLALAAETPLTQRFNVGIQFDHTEIRTTGTHHMYMYGTEYVNETWSNGVSVTSDQTSITAFLRGCF